MAHGLEELRRSLLRIDGRGYKAYGEVRGRWEHEDLALHVDHVQGDPFAAPSQLRLRVPHATSGLPRELFGTPVRRMALADALARRAARVAGGGRRRGSGKSGVVSVDAGGQEVLERTAVAIDDGWVELRLQVGLPAAGRRVLGRAAAELLCDELPELAASALHWENLSREDICAFVDCVDNQEHLRAQLTHAGLIAFVADGSILPRESGASDRPLARECATPFVAPEALSVELELAHPLAGPDGPRTTLRGLGIRCGITLIVGGGYHGKSTLLRALERCVYPHVPGDGREWCVSDLALVKVRAEDGRRVEQVDISAFIGELPQGRSTQGFCSDDASGSTSQAANIVEALELGASGLLLDEDTSATNFMVRDARMQALVAKAHEPITPFLERVKEIHEVHGVSTVLVMGGCGDYFDVADRVIAMREFLPEDATAEAHRIAAAAPSGRTREASHALRAITPRCPIAESLDASRGRRDVKIDVRERDLLAFGEHSIDLRGVEQLLDRSQTRAVGFALHLAATRWMADGRSLCEIVDEIEALFDSEGLDGLDPRRRGERHPGNFARPRRFEIAAAINRLRSVRMRQLATVS
ncbi:MAG: ABC-ATPase domain-containing protein [Deltaproteobacteria bacterium]|nr:ABC-ATPase domain-containing protein [Deltaproteobacteria bacterium]MBW2359869.1 ABC-ATPase domain-containing protein [Deltaproteobacteria bacterium]